MDAILLWLVVRQAAGPAVGDGARRRASHSAGQRGRASQDVSSGGNQYRIGMQCIGLEFVGIEQRRTVRRETEQAYIVAVAA